MSQRIVFMGTPDFAVESLKQLVEYGLDVVGVVTVPDKPAGRGYKLKASPVKEYAISQNLKVLQPVNLKEEAFISELKSLNPDLIVVVAFRMLPKVVWSMPSKGTFNLHGSLLPDYRGAAPINWAVINGEKETGVTTFFIDENIDTGKIIDQEKIYIDKNESAGDVHDRLMKIGGELVVKTVKDIFKENVAPVPQENILKGRAPKMAPKIFKETCEIDFSKSSKEVHDFVRGMYPFPAAHCYWLDNEGKEIIVKVLKTLKSDLDIPIKTIKTINNKLFIGCGEGAVEIIELQMAGKKRMKTEDFLRGIDISKYSLKTKG